MAILDADKTGFLRSETSLIQTIGRSARNVNAKVILYGDKVTEAMKNAIDETDRRRKLQRNLQPRAQHHAPDDQKDCLQIESDLKAHREANEWSQRRDRLHHRRVYQRTGDEMLAAAEELDFERAAYLRDRIGQMRDAIGKPLSSVKPSKSSGGRKGRRGRRKPAKVPRPGRKQD